MEAGVIASLKAWFRRRQANHAIYAAHAIINTNQHASKTATIYRADVLQVMKLCQEAWESVVQSTIAN